MSSGNGWSICTSEDMHPYECGGQYSACRWCVYADRAREESELLLGKRVAEHVWRTEFFYEDSLHVNLDTQLRNLKAEVRRLRRKLADAQEVLR